MNLRQKIKKAKRELKELENTIYDKNSTWEIINRTEKQIKLQNVINYKRKFNTYCHENEQNKINLKKLTYIGYNADFTDLGVCKSPNGKPLNKKKVLQFIDEVIRTKVYDYTLKIARETVKTGNYTPRVDYFVSFSYDKTKNKRLYRKMIAYQYVGSDEIYFYKDEK